jgi:hypothetical protein
LHETKFGGQRFFNEDHAMTVLILIAGHVVTFNVIAVADGAHGSLSNCSKTYS